MSVALSLAALALPFVLGLLAGARRFFPRPDDACDVLHRLTLHVAFPALVVVGLADPRAEVVRHLAYVALVPLSVALALIAVRLGTQRAPATRGTLALVVAFGNTAYLGFPYLTSVLGTERVSVVAVAVAAHVACSMTCGPLLLARWGRAGSTRGVMARLVRQPLLWSPVVGLALRLAPDALVVPLRAWIGPLGQMASPLSMILLGLHVWSHRSAVRLDRHVVVHVLVRLVAMPAWTLALALVALRLGMLDATEAKVLVLLAAMPAAITTFSIAHEQGEDTGRIAAVIVASTVLCPLTLAAWTAAVFALV